MIPYTIDIVGDEMVVLDEDGNDCDRYRLVGLRSAKRQLRRWQSDCDFDYAGALMKVEEFFSTAMQEVHP